MLTCQKHDRVGFSATPLDQRARIVAPVGEGGAEALLAVEHASGAGEAGAH
jgi:hypothetical protein